MMPNMRVIPKVLRRSIVPLAALVMAACLSAGVGSPISPGTPVPTPGAPVPTVGPIGVPVSPSSLSPSSDSPSPVSPSPHPGEHLDQTPWGRTIDRLIGARQISVAVRVGPTLTYAHLADTRRAPASNEKLLLSMTALGELGPDYRIPTDAAVEPGTLHSGVVHGDLWIVGHGDPEFDDAAVRALGAKIRAAGVRRITGSVLGDTAGFVRDRHAPGWHRMALDNVGLPTALSFDHNVGPSGFVLIPELKAAQALTAALRTDGVMVGSSARAAAASGSLHRVATVRSAPLADILRRQNITSDNTAAETLSKVLGAQFGGEGSIAAGALVIHAWLHDHGVGGRVLDASGLSYRDRISPLALTRLLTLALHRPWGSLLRASLPQPGQGTLGDRLTGIAVRAKTGTLTQGISALSGFIRLRSGRTAVFSILSQGLVKDTAVRIEDAIVRTVASKA